MSNNGSFMIGGRSSPVSFGLSPPHDGSDLEFTELTNLDLFPALNTMNPKDNSEDTNIPIIPKDLDSSSPDIMSDVSSTKSLDVEAEDDSVEFIGAKSAYKKIKMSVCEEKQLMDYFSNHSTLDKNVPLKVPCVKLVRLANDVGMRNGSPGVRIVKTVDRKRLLSNYDDDNGDDNIPPPEKSSKCMSKNAVLAREARQKKKEQLADLENANKKLLKENQCMKTSMLKMEEATKSLQDEIRYLRGVIANQSTLSSLLKNINTSEVVLTSSENLTDINSNVSTKPSSTSIVKKGEIKRKEPKTSKKANLDDNLITTSQKVARSQKVTETDHAYQKSGQANSSDSRKPVGSVSFSDSDSGVQQAAGVCLHVAKGVVSLEFCSQCCTKAGKAIEKLVAHENDD